ASCSNLPCCATLIRNIRRVLELPTSGKRHVFHQLHWFVSSVRNHPSIDDTLDIGWALSLQQVVDKVARGSWIVVTVQKVCGHTRSRERDGDPDFRFTPCPNRLHALRRAMLIPTRDLTDHPEVLTLG